MKIVDLNLLDQKSAYTLYDSYISIKEDLDTKENLTDKDRKKVEILKLQISEIEHWAATKLKEDLRWTKEEIWKEYGKEAVLIVNFHPSTDSYKKYGKEASISIQFSEEELLEMATNIRNNHERKSGTINFRLSSDDSKGSLDTRDIFEIWHKD